MNDDNDNCNNNDQKIMIVGSNNNDVSNKMKSRHPLSSLKASQS